MHDMWTSLFLFFFSLLTLNFKVLSGINNDIQIVYTNCFLYAMLVTFMCQFTVLCCACYAGESTSEVSIEINTEADVSDDKPYLCTVCFKRFRMKQGLTIHRELHTGVMYTCCQFEKVFSLKSSLRRHMNIHTGKYKCSVCGRCCGCREHLEVHRRSHSGEKLFECTVCNKRFSTSRSLVVHHRVHSGEKPYKCHKCDKAFRQFDHLDYHMYVHTSDNPYKCSLCDKSFTKSSSLQQHKRRTHSKSRPYECPYCGKLLDKHRSEVSCSYSH